MTAQKYFQWQNPIICETIYPMRKQKLRDFLVFYQQMDLWAVYKDRDVSELQSDIDAALKIKSKALVTAFEAYNQLRNYFLTPDVTSEFETPDEKEVGKINQTHSTFIKYLPKYTDVRKEENFVKSQTTQWKEHLRILQQQVARKERRLRNMRSDHPKYPTETKELEDMQVPLQMANTELDRMRAFVDAIKGIKERRLAFDKEQKKIEVRKKKIDQRLGELTRRLKPLTPKEQELSATLQRLKSPPNIGDLQAYFSQPDTSAKIREIAPQAEQSLIDHVNALHQTLMAQLGYSPKPAVQLTTIENHVYNWSLELKKLEKEAAKHEADLRNMPATWKKRPEREQRLQQIREVDAKVIAADVDTLKDFHVVLALSIKPQDELEKDIQDLETELKELQQSISVLQDEERQRQAEAANIEAKSVGALERFMTTYVPDKKITVQDVAIWKGEAYRTLLMDKDQMELLEEVAKRFWEHPERYPPWLQYMVVHFSGMRYASAHGSWADPRDLLIRLQAPEIETEIKALDDETIKGRCLEKIATYETPNENSPKLATAQEKDWKVRLSWHLPHIKSRGLKTRRRGLTELSQDEAAYELWRKPTDEALEILLSMKERFPDWAWKQIVKLTPLRITEVTDPNWEDLTNQPTSYSGDDNKLRLILGEWRSHNTTLWRQEHARSQELIVSRAVCNETAEHCQHLRGHKPPGGLTPKAKWYLANEGSSDFPGEPRPYYVRPTSEEHFTVGASILWLRFVNSEPNAWQIAKNVTTRDGVGLMPDKNPRSSWTYKAGDTITRSRKVSGGKKQKISEYQWLRWIHEATIAEVGETAEGKVVLTYETALPDDDRGTSSIGIFQKPLWWFLTDGTEDDYNRCFVGYVPEGQLPVDNIARMLDWEKILLRPIKPDEIETYIKEYPYIVS